MKRTRSSSSLLLVVLLAVLLAVASASGGRRRKWKRWVEPDHGPVAPVGPAEPAKVSGSYVFTQGTSIGTKHSAFQRNEAYAVTEGRDASAKAKSKGSSRAYELDWWGNVDNSAVARAKAKAESTIDSDGEIDNSVDGFRKAKVTGDGGFTAVAESDADAMATEYIYKNWHPGGSATSPAPILSPPL